MLVFYYRLQIVFEIVIILDFIKYKNVRKLLAYPSLKVLIYHGDKFIDCSAILERQYTMSQITLFVVCHLVSSCALCILKQCIFSK